MSKTSAPSTSEVTENPYEDLVTIRMIRLFMTLRRATILAQRRRFGLSEIEWRIMVQIGDGGPLSLNGLAEQMLQDRGQLSRAVKAMVARGLLTRERKPGGPEIEIDLSDDGSRLHKEMIGFVVERDEKLTKGIDPDDLAALWRVIDVMYGRAQAMFEDEQKAGS